MAISAAFIFAVSAMNEDGTDNIESGAAINETIKDIVIIKDRSDYEREEILEMVESDFRQNMHLSEDSDSDTLLEEIYFNINYLQPYISGAGSGHVSYDITLEPLPQNTAITSSKYLGRDHGLVVEIECSNHLGKTTDTAWWYSIDATRIARSIFDSDIGKRIGVLAIVFNEPEKEREISFILYAADAEQLRPFWSEEGSCIKFSDWSLVDTGRTDLVMYEDPSSSVKISPGIISKPSCYFDAENIDIDSLISESSLEILQLFDRTKRAVEDQDYAETVSSSEVLLSKCYEKREKFSKMLSANPGSDTLKQYIETIDLYSAAGSAYWYGSVYLDMDRISQGNQYFMEAAGRVDQTAGSLENNSVLANQLPVIITSSVANQHNLNSPVHYQDPSGCNDISINVEGYKLASVLSVKDGGEIKLVKSQFGRIFLAVTVDIYHLGYRGGGTEIVTNPSRNDFVLIYDGIEYKDITPDYYIRNIGEVYKLKTLQRLEHYEANLIYEIDYDGEFDPALASVKVNLGNDQDEHIWVFED